MHVNREPSIAAIREVTGKEQRPVHLSDGSVIQLNAHTTVLIEFSDKQRMVRMLSGEARFVVAKDRHRPFLVRTPHLRIQAVGTMFNVQIAKTRTSVTVLKGKVRVAADEKAVVATTSMRPISLHSLWNSSASPMMLVAGQQVESTPGTEQLSISASPVPEHINSWPVHTVTYRDATLTDVIAAVNRYQDRAVRITDSRLASHTVNGFFNLHDQEAMLPGIAAAFSARVTRLADGSEVLMRDPESKLRSRTREMQLAE